MCPGETARNAEGPERPAGPAPATQAPPPHGPGRRGERVHCSLLSGVFKVVCKDVGGRSLTCPQVPP